MSLIVQKFGGTSVADLDRIRNVARRVVRTYDQGNDVVVVLSAMAGITDKLIDLAQGLEVPADYYITSPTFTLINEYPARLPLFHIDLYRLETVSDLEDIGLDELLYDQAVLAVEWADKLPDDVFDAYLSMTFEMIDDTCRKISMKASGQNEIDLIKALKKNVQH